jgi:PKHD-type hydroxylase
MNFQILPILDPAELEQVVSDLSQQTFTDGKLTAYGSARAVKNNLQAEQSEGETEEIDNIVMNALWRNETFQAFASPRRVVAPLFARYDVGMSYGAHVDAAVMGTDEEAVRSDLAMTVFLSDPDTYDGGALVLQMPFGEQAIKLAAGEAVIYSASTLHHVEPVTRGTRFVAVTWIQSVVRDEQLRTILFDLSRAEAKAEALGDAGLTSLLNKSCHNLLRHAADM